MFLKYNEWERQRRAELESTDPWLDCPQCNGNGEYLHECEECGHEDEWVCQRCDETGKLRYSEFNALEIHGLFQWPMYAAELLTDSRALSEWSGREQAAILVSEGLTPYTELVQRVEFTGGCRVITGYEPGEIKIMQES